MAKQKVTKADVLLHGGDYNPDQWLDYPEVLEQDIELMKASHTNTFSVGIFAWAALEPEEGVYNFEWLDKIFERVSSIDGNIILATPSGARPAWMSQKYPEVLRVDEYRRKQLHGKRHNHCFTSPYYRKKTQEMNRKLAERYGEHPALLMWHISNEYGGECHCDLCQEAFRDWLKDKYDHNLDKLNHSWWGPFWSHTFNDWSQIESPSPIGEDGVHGLNLDWKRFVTHQTIDFYKNEIVPIREISPNIPITTNFMSDNPEFVPFRPLDYSQFAKEVDVISWDAYPAWHNDYESTAETASKVGFMNDLFKSLKQQPFLLMENTPSMVNWHEVNKAKRPGMHYLSSMQMLAHGSDSILYFQWRKSRGSFEKFHGAVVDHDGSTENRVFKEIAKLGQDMESLSSYVVGSSREADVAIFYDWDNNWALEDAKAFSDESKKYGQTLEKHYKAFWEKDIPVDVITKENSFSDYKLLIVPMLYLISEETMERLKEFVENGGTVVSTYITGLVDEHDLTYLGGWPAPLKELFGVEPTEVDTFYPKDKNSFTYNGETYEIKDYASIIENTDAEVLGEYVEDFYSGTPALTAKETGKGRAYYLGARFSEAFHKRFYGELIEELSLKPILKADHQEEISIQGRKIDDKKFVVFIMNFSEEEKSLELHEEVEDVLSKETLSGKIKMKPYEVFIVLKEEK